MIVSLGSRELRNDSAGSNLSSGSLLFALVAHMFLFSNEFS